MCFPASSKDSGTLTASCRAFVVQFGATLLGEGVLSIELGLCIRREAVTMGVDDHYISIYSSA